MTVYDMSNLGNIKRTFPPTVKRWKEGGTRGVLFLCTLGNSLPLSSLPLSGGDRRQASDRFRRVFRSGSPTERARTRPDPSEKKSLVKKQGALEWEGSTQFVRDQDSRVPNGHRQVPVSDLPHFYLSLFPDPDQTTSVFSLSLFVFCTSFSTLPSPFFSHL